ncbi:MAG: SusE domain-containing protein [Janthinobacterium lividum]
MKKSLTKVLAAFATLLVVATSCKKDETQATLSSSGNSTLTVTPGTVVLSQANIGKTAVTFVWQPVTFNWANAEHPYNPAVTYTFQIDKKGNQFAKPVTFSAGTTSPTTLSVEALNDMLTTMGLTPSTAYDLEVRLASTYSNNVSAVYSPTVALNATPYLYICNAPAGSNAWAIIGPAGVDWNTDVPMKYNCTTNTFDVTMALKADEFKFRADKAWTLNYGSNTSTGGALVAGGSNIKVATAGTYTIKLDLNTMTYTIK